MVYREESPVYMDIWDWDIILYYGSIRIVGYTKHHIRGCGHGEFGYSCDCMEALKITSAILDKNKRMLQQNFWKPWEPGDGRALLGVKEGDALRVHSEKLFRLKGPRQVQGHDAWAPASIWYVYADQEELPEKPKGGFWQTLREWITQQSRKAA